MTEVAERVTKFLTDNGFKFSAQVEIDGCQFTDTGKYTVDFYLTDYDLYVEVADTMTMHHINELISLHNAKGRNFHVLEMTDENWIRPFDRDKDQSVQKKIEENIEIQFKDLVDMKKGVTSVRKMSYLSFIRLMKYRGWYNVEREMWAMMREAKSEEEKREIFDLAVEAANKRRSIISLKNEQNGTFYMLDEDELEKAAEFRDKHIEMHIKKVQPSLGEWTTYTFCDTGLGVLKTIKCNCCGEELLLTDFSKW